MPIGFIIDTEFVWGFTARVVGLSKTAPSFLYPPPSTFLGSLAEVIAKKHALGEKVGLNVISSLSKNLLAIGVRPINCIAIKYTDLNRIITIRKRSGKLYPRADDVTASFDSPARGKTALTSIDSNAPILRWLLVFSNRKIKVYEIEIELNKDYFWKIHRVGSKESRVAVLDVKESSNLKIIRQKIVETKYSFPLFKKLKIIKMQGTWEDETYINPFQIEEYSEKENPVLNYIMGKKLLRFKVPTLLFKKPLSRIDIGESYSAYSIGGEVVIGR